MPESWRKITRDFTSIAERDQWFRDNAEYFSVGRRLGPRKGYERYEVQTLVEAENLARRKANEANRAFLIYAIVGSQDAFVKAIHPSS